MTGGDDGRESSGNDVEIDIEIDREPADELEAERGSVTGSTDETVDASTPPHRETVTPDQTTDTSSAHAHPPSGARRLGDELGRIDLMTDEHGHVEARVTDLEALDETTVRLEVTLPHGAVETFDLEKPLPWSRGFLLARIVEDTGYDAASIEHVVGESVLLERVDHREEDDAGRRWRLGWDVDRWRDDVVQATGDAILASLGGHFRLEERRTPEWRLVDPLEREDEADETSRRWGTWIAASCVLLGAVAAVVGAVAAVGVTTVTASLLGAVLPGLALVALGCYWLVGRSRR